MEANIWINEFELRGDEDPEVTFFGDVEHVPEQIYGMEQEGIPEHYEVEAEWNRSIYSEEDNKIIENYIPKAERELIKLVTTF